MDSDQKSFGSVLGRITRFLSDRFRLVRISREFWIFVLFLCVSVLFWCVQTLKDKTTIDLQYALRFSNVPSNVIVTTDLPKTISVSLTGKGFSVIGRLLRNEHPVLDVDFLSLPMNDQCATIDINMWKKLLSRTLPQEISVASVTPSPLEIYTSTGKHKQLPVIFASRVTVPRDHALFAVNVSPQYVDVYAPDEIFDTITTVYTEDKLFSNVMDTLRTNVRLKQIKGVKFVPDSVHAEMCVDLLTMRTIRIPVTTENVPEGRILKTFPAMVDVTFKVGSSLYNDIRPDEFQLVVDYASIAQDDSRCKVMLRRMPRGISSVTVSPQEVEYLIER